MSGGVDSSTSAWILKRDGHQVVGVTLRFHDSARLEAKARKAVEVAEKLGIEHHVVDARQRFFRELLVAFARTASLQGSIVNPCLICTSQLKVPLLFEAADAYGCDAVALGHYAKVTSEGFGVGLKRYQLRSAADRSKDQSFLLHRLGQEQLSRLIFPLQDTSKGVVRRMAMQAGLQRLSPVNDGQGTPCFFDDGGAVEWLAGPGGVEAKPGDVVDLGTHERIGRHEGLYRHELGSEYAPGIFAIAKDLERNELLVGPAALARTELVELSDMFWTSVEPPEKRRSCRVRTAYGTVPVPAQLVAMGDGRAVASFTTPVAGIHAGSTLVFYSDDLVLGGGTVLR